MNPKKKNLIALGDLLKIMDLSRTNLLQCIGVMRYVDTHYTFLKARFTDINKGRDRKETGNVSPWSIKGESLL